ncbi:nucleotidyltransferase [Sulfolobus sp. A20]|uniref:nucleotidyltransferase n=1 Tax=Saccharolobus sp. A20 TaxID=1891280 RepID=UPI00084608D5|nr:nucleotidyltransferase [Sulfolobus sp. A20]AOL16178.1 nucleotidyltransferase [Sulfolobus sp. A20]TRM77805.1 nucleotidyltransferase [Sulfolobus sp. A20-N-F8]TRM81751.1 nucleotidyltransferase [Sulfolobus sp. A20-N-F6]TRM90035.1 nucleotidyltransferase [Sulfolobus sp. A20-N-G8]
MIQFSKIGEILHELQSLTDFVIIGDTILDLQLKRKGTDSDIDIFVLGISVLVDDDAIRDFAYQRGWDYGRTPIDTPRLFVPVDDDQLQIDLYENIQDFFVPKEIIENAIDIKLGNYQFKTVRLEDYILLKANAFREEDEDELKTIVYLIGEGKLSVDKNYIREHIKLFEENSESIKERLSYIGIKI